MKPSRVRILFCISILLLCSRSAIQIAAQEAKTTVVRINYARHTEYEKNESSGNEIIVLTGNVSMTVEKEKTTLDIEAASVRYDRKTSMLFAQGDVVLKSSGTGNKQDATANSMLLNTDTLEGILDNSRIVRYGESDTSIPSGSTLVASSKILGTGPSNTMAFKHATISFCDDDNPHWKIRATKAWMLPGGEFAFLNALLYVGPVPILYLPAFYYPKDELIFNPVIGIDARKGYFLQTTTYLWGRKPLSAYTAGTDANDDSFNFSRPSTLKEQVREGVILHNLDIDYTGETKDYLKLTGDYYSRLGGMLGLDGNFTPQSDSFIPTISGFVDIAFSNTIFYYPDEEQFSRYGISMDGIKRYQDYSSFLGFNAPFRYGGNLKITGKKRINYTLSLPVYSDPYFMVDYGSRNEYMNWIDFLTKSRSDEINDEMKVTDDDSRFISSFNWDAKVFYTFPEISKFDSYYITNARVDLASSVLFKSWKRTDTEFQEQPLSWKLYSPERQIFYPSLVTPIKFSANAEGSLFKYPVAEKESNKEQEASEEDVLGPEEENGKKPELTEEEVGKNTKDPFSSDDLPLLGDILLPALAEFKGFEYSLDYSLKPQYVKQDSYSTSMLFTENTEFDRKKVFSSYYELDVPIEVKNKLSYRSRFLSFTNTLAFDPHYQKHPDLTGYTDESSRDSVLNSDYGAKKFDINDGNIISFRPFMYDSVLYDTGIDWTSKIKVLRTKYTGDAKHPDWDYIPMDLTDDKSFIEHTLTGYVVAKESDKTSQKFTASTSLPPRAGEKDFMIDLTFPHVDFNFSSGVERIEPDEDDEDAEVEFKDKPLKQALTVSFFKTLKFTESFNFNMEENHYDSLKLAMSWCGFQAAYTMQYAYGYDFIPPKGWTADEEKEFQPYSFTLSYSSPTKKFRYWRKRISWAPSLQTSFVYNMIKPTESYFTFIPAMTFKINQFLYLTFSSESQNSVVFRYFEDHTKYGDIISGEKNPFTDLANSFAFWDTSLRQASGFKVKNFKITFAHNLHDWTLAACYIFKPKLTTDSNNKSVYSYDPYFSFIINWRPMSGLRTQVIDEYGDIQLNP